MAISQAVSGTEDWKNVYKNFSRDFFDLVIVDECHRGSAAEDSAWREILDYFNSATHIGLTATPSETRDGSSEVYFGKPIYSHSLKHGIDDGCLARYKEIRVVGDVDAPGSQQVRGQTARPGE